MTSTDDLEIFLSTVPGLERFLLAEAEERSFKSAEASKGGVTVRGDWREVWRANLMLRGASHVLVRLGSFKAMHLAQLDKRAHRFPWTDVLRADLPVRVEVSCKKSRIYHDKAAAERIEKAIRETLGAEINKDASICIKVRIISDICTISVDTSGEPLHKRGHKAVVNKAPMRESLAALLLRACGYRGREAVVDPMCGSGTFVIEAAEIAAGLAPGRSRRFAFEQLATFDPSVWQKLKEQVPAASRMPCFYGFDRDQGAVQMSEDNATRAGIAAHTAFARQAISELKAPEESTGLVIVNPPYGARLGDQKKLLPLYQTLGKTLKQRFPGWRIGIITNSAMLADATGLPFKKRKVAFSHGGISVKLYATVALPKTDSC